MAKQTGIFIDDARLHPRDNSGGPQGPKDGGQFGGGGKVIGGEPAESNSTEAMDDDELNDKGTPARRPGTKGGY